MGKGSMREMGISAGRWASKAQGKPPTKDDDEKAEAVEEKGHGKDHGQCGGDCPMMKTLKKKGLI